LQPHARENNNNDQHSIFGIFLIFIALSVALAAIVSEFAFLNKVVLYYYVIIWIGSFAVTFVSLFHNKSAIQRRMKNSLRWSTNAKSSKWGVLVRTICHNSDISFPFTLFSVSWYWIRKFSTYLLLKRYNDISSHEQLIFSLVSLAAIPVTFEVHSSIVEIIGDVAILLSRIFVSLAYAAGGIYAIKTKTNH